MKLWPARAQTLERETIEAIDGTEISLQAQISSFWDSLRGLGYSPRFLDRVWAANRCLQLNAQQIASMPLRFFGAPSAAKPAWVSSPDPAWYPNGIGDAIFAAAWSMYGWGDAFILITTRYADGFPSGWTVLHPAPMSVESDQRGGRQYRYGGKLLDAGDVVQITRDPRGGLRGEGALRSYATHLWSAELTGLLGQSVSNVPNAVLKSQRKLTKLQALDIQQQWVDAVVTRRGAPAVLPPEIDFEQLAFSPKDLLLLDAQQFEARVIASAFGVPPFLLNLPLEGGLTYQSPEMLVEQWWRVELRPAAMRITQALSANMLPRGSWVEADARDVLAPPLPELVKAWSTMLADGTVTKDEYRAAVLRLPPMEVGEALDELTVPSVAAASTTSENSNVQALRPQAQEVAL